MTIHLLDVASYQGSLSPDDVIRAGFRAVNLKISHGLGQKSVHPRLTWWIDQARALGLGISTFHYFTAEAGGIAQAEYAYARLAALGLTVGTVHQMDVESNPAPTLAEVRAYLTRMTELLGRPVILYTGDWWWQPKGWNVSDLTPYLWSAPNAGYLGSYPGDTSPHWKAGYGGWPVLSSMQYAVAPLTFPGGGTGSIDVSKSAIREPNVWRDLTEGRPGVSYAPATLLAARKEYIDRLAKAGFKISPLAVGIVGDDSHANSGTSYHLGKDALKSGAYSVVESSRDRNGLSNAAAAVDYGNFSTTVNGKTHNLKTFSKWLVDQAAAGAPDTKDIREIIYSLDGKTVKRWDRLGKRTTGDSSHTTHTHVSHFRDSEKRAQTYVKRYFDEVVFAEEDPNDMAMDKATFLAWFKEGMAAFPAGDDKKPESIVGQRVWAQPLPNPFRGGERSTAWQLLGDVAATAVAEKGTDVAAKNEVIATIKAASVAEVAALDKAVQDLLNGLGGSDLSTDELAQLLVTVLGARADEVADKMKDQAGPTA